MEGIRVERIGELVGRQEYGELLRVLVRMEGEAHLRTVTENMGDANELVAYYGCYMLACQLEGEECEARNVCIKFRRNSKLAQSSVLVQLEVLVKAVQEMSYQSVYRVKRDNMPEVIAPLVDELVRQFRRKMLTTVVRHFTNITGDRLQAYVGLTGNVAEALESQFPGEFDIIQQETSNLYRVVYKNSGDTEMSIDVENDNDDEKRQRVANLVRLATYLEQKEA